MERRAKEDDEEDEARERAKNKRRGFGEEGRKLKGAEQSEASPDVDAVRPKTTAGSEREGLLMTEGQIGRAAAAATAKAR